MDVIKVEDDLDIGPSEFVFETVELPAPTKNISLWSNGETKKLIDLYKDFIVQVGPLKRFRRKKDMWSEISLQIANKNSKQCEERFKTLLRRKKKGNEKVYISESKRIQFDMNDTDVNEEELQIIRQQIRLSESAGIDCTAPFKQIQVWSTYETKLLMELYNRLINEVGPEKRFMHKKDMWSEISTNFINKSSKQCQERFKTVLNRKKRNPTKTVYISKERRMMIDSIANDNTENALKIQRVPLLKNDKISANKSKMERNQRNQKSVREDKSGDARQQNIMLNISKTLLKITTKKEEGRERRHREKMKALEKIQKTLQQILNRTEN